MVDDDCCPDDPAGCETAGDGDYRITFYKGFMRLALVDTPGGGKTLYDQGVNNPYVVGGTGKRPPADRFKLRLESPGKDVQLRVDNSPLDPETYKGPIESITVVTGEPSGPPIVDSDRVRIITGGEKVLAIYVHLRKASGVEGDRGKGGGRPRDMEGGPTETWVIENNAQTCPRQCDP